ncbi:proline-rich receptor-like protein kinase PERK9 [Iris pallida]|uniref:Proline-rich receptor-like protein kinase PERK9 n=1 Tax=Iris pallida TaxID=29817 RepID=A0AAX6FSP2_IRIPA|nr:proline-rich receptor-like protein kinase PERK9 [Iris pallida]
MRRIRHGSGSADSATTPTVLVQFRFLVFLFFSRFGLCRRWECLMVARASDGWLEENLGSRADYRRSGEMAVVVADVWVAGVLVGARDAAGQRQ